MADPCTLQNDSAAYGALCAALRDAFPHFQEDAPITPERIKSLGNEWHDMVMNWEPTKSEIPFVDSEGNTGKLVWEDGWFFEGMVAEPTKETA
jgi:hypothetical protein